MPKKNIFSFIVVTIWFLTGNVIHAAPSYNPFTDLPSGNPYFKDIISLYQKGLIEGYDDKTFRPDQLITRAEFVKMVLGAGQCIDCRYPPSDIKKKYSEQPFPDVLTEAWYFYCVSHGKNIGIITGYLGGDKKGLFSPADSISRAESIAILLRSLGVAPQDNLPLILKDVPDQAWYKGYIKTAVERGLIPYRNGFVAPEEKIQRAEFAHLVNFEWNESECIEIRKDEAMNMNLNDNSGGVTGESMAEATQDSDDDGVPDSDDICPHIPGNLVYATSQNGCPSVGEHMKNIQEGLYITMPACNTCPCPVLEYTADIRPGDIIFSAIADDTNQTIYTKSNLYYIDR